MLRGLEVRSEVASLKRLGDLRRDASAREASRRLRGLHPLSDVLLTRLIQLSHKSLDRGERSQVEGHAKSALV